MANNFEVNARKLKLDQLFKAQSTNHDRMKRISELDTLRREQDKTGNQIREDFQKSLDLETFRSQLDAWGRQEGYLSFSGMNGQMFLNQLISYSTEPEKLVSQLARWLTLPKSSTEAAKAINELAAYAASIKQGGRPAPRRSIYFLSFFLVTPESQ